MAAPTLSPHDAVWPRLYAAEAPEVAEALAPVVEIQHVGSTSVPGLASKPTVDIAVTRRSLALNDVAHACMERLGYRYGGGLGLPQQVFRKGDRFPWCFLVHVVEAGGQMWHDYLRFRDYLRANPADAARYTKLKASPVSRTRRLVQRTRQRTLHQTDPRRLARLTRSGVIPEHWPSPASRTNGRRYGPARGDGITGTGQSPRPLGGRRRSC